MYTKGKILSTFLLLQKKKKIGIRSETWTSDEYVRPSSLQNKPFLVWLSDMGLLRVVMVIV